jgi:hypothetical protein
MIRNCYIILHIRPGPPYPDVASPQIAADGPFALSDDIWIEKLDTELAKRIQRACEPAHYNIHSDVWDRHQYAFVRKIRAQESPQNQGLNDLHTIIALSRLIRPTSTGERYCAKIFAHPENDEPIQALQSGGVCPDVLLGDTSHDWLSPEDGRELRQMVPWIPTTKQMHRRVHRAFWNHEQALRCYYLDMRWNLVVSGLEALIAVEERNVTQQFIERVGNLGIEFGIPLTKEELRRAYKLRSGLAHARGFLYDFQAVLPSSEHKPLYDKLESLLRSTVKRSLLDESFGQHFADKDAARNRWSAQPTKVKEQAQLQEVNDKARAVSGLD